MRWPSFSCCEWRSAGERRELCLGCMTAPSFHSPWLLPSMLLWRVMAAAGLLHQVVHAACPQSQQSYAALCSMKAIHLAGCTLWLPGLRSPPASCRDAMGSQHGNQQVSSAFLDLFAEVARQGDPGQIRLAPDKCEQHTLPPSRCPVWHAQPCSLPGASLHSMLAAPIFCHRPNWGPTAVLRQQPEWSAACCSHQHVPQGERARPGPAQPAKGHHAAAQRHPQAVWDWGGADHAHPRRPGAVVRSRPVLPLLPGVAQDASNTTCLNQPFRPPGHMS